MTVSLDLPVVGLTPAPTWATKNNAALSALADGINALPGPRDAVVAAAERDVLCNRLARTSSTPPTVVFFGKGIMLSVAAIASGGTGYAVNDIITLAGGTFTAPAKVKVTSVTSGAVTAVSVYTPGIYSVAPTNPTAQASTTGSGTGATFTGTYQTLGGSNIDNATSFTNPSDATHFGFLGRTLTNIGGSGFYGSGVTNTAHSVFRWATNTRNIVIRLIGANTKFELLVDGEYIPLSSYSTDSTGAWYSLCLDFGSANWREFELIAINTEFGGIRTDNGSLCIPLTSTPKLLAVSIGDSYTGGSFARSVGSTHIYTMARILGLDLVTDGVGGTGWNSTGSNVPATRITTNLGGLNALASVKYVFFDLGYNDSGTDMTAAASAFDAAVAAVASVAPTAQIVVFGPATPQGATTGLDAVRTMLMDRCTAHGLDFVDQRNLLNLTNAPRYVYTDNTHPTADGHRYLGAVRAVDVRSLLAA